MQFLCYHLSSHSAAKECQFSCHTDRLPVPVHIYRSHNHSARLAAMLAKLQFGLIVPHCKEPSSHSLDTASIHKNQPGSQRSLVLLINKNLHGCTAHGFVSWNKRKLQQQLFAPHVSHVVQLLVTLRQMPHSTPLPAALEVSPPAPRTITLPSYVPDS